MKSKCKLSGIIAFIAIIWFSMASCTTTSTMGGAGVGGEANSALNGIWTALNEEMNLKNDGSFEASTGGIQAFKGTYTTSSNNITLNITQLYGGHPEFKLEPKWYSRNDLSTLGVTDADLNTIFAPSTGTYSISGNNLTFRMLKGPFAGTATYIKKASAAKIATVTVDALNFRSGPGTNSTVLKTLKKGDTLTVTGDAQNGWLPVEHQGTRGYVSSEMVSVK